MSDTEIEVEHTIEQTQSRLHQLVYSHVVKYVKRVRTANYYNYYSRERII